MRENRNAEVVETRKQILHIALSGLVAIVMAAMLIAASSPSADAHSDSSQRIESREEGQGLDQGGPPAVLYADALKPIGH